LKREAAFDRARRRVTDVRRRWTAGRNCVDGDPLRVDATMRWMRRLFAAMLLVLLWVAPAAPAAVRVPPGVKLQRYAQGIPNPSNLAFDGHGRLWATSSGVQAAAADGVWMVPRRGARPRQVVSGLFSALGLTWHRRELYVSHIVPHATFAPRHTGRVVAYSGFDGRRFARSRVVVDGLPVGRHRVDSIVAGPGGRLYLGIGSESDHEPSSAALAGTVVSFRPGGGGLRVEARGLRNPYGLAVAQGGRRLLVSEHGRDDLGLHSPPDELNLVNLRGRARSYGFPGCWGQGGAPCRGTVGALARLAPHSALGAVVATRRFGRWGPSAFVTRFGSTFRENPTGGDVVRVPLARLGRRRTAPVHRFATGFGHQEPLGAALGPGGALYVSLWQSGRIVRLVPKPPPHRAAAAAKLTPPATLLRALAELLRDLFTD
jgi:glucose/arabinose dehydrogenase